MDDDSLCECVYCKNDKPFDLPDHLVDACIKGKVVLFAGAGISTETNLVFPSTLYQDILYDLKEDPDSTTLTFPKAMSAFAKREGRAELLKRIKQRLDYVSAFPELYRSATRFHRELSTIYPIREIFTTNWDSFFEDEAGAVPVVTSADYAFWELPYRKVFKLHGSINNVGTIIATEEDYRKCYRDLKNGVIGGRLKHILATKTLIFIGYSFRDDDFRRIYSFIQKEMGELIPRSYIVTTSKTVPSKVINSQMIHTDGRYFLEKLKSRLVERGVMLSDDRFEDVEELLHLTVAVHHAMLDRYEFAEYPELVYASSYQDGLIHAFERILSRRAWGEYSDEHHIGHMIHDYERMRKGAIRQRRYFDAAYIEGYLNGLLTLVMDKKELRRLPLFFVFGSRRDLRTPKQFGVDLAKAGRLHRAASLKAQRMVKKLNGMIPQHTAFLDGVEPV